MKLSRLGTLALPVLFLLGGCDESRLSEPEQGYWVSEPYGSALHIVADAVMHYEFTPDYCLLSKIETLSKSEFLSRYQIADNELFSPTYLGLPMDDNDFGIEYESSSKLPEICRHDIFDLTSGIDNNSPEVTLEIFLQTFSQYHYSFESVGVDWTEVGQQARWAVSEQTSRAELFEIMSEAIKPLQNGHAFISDGDKVAVYRQSEKPILYERLRNEFLTKNDLTPPLTISQNSALAEYIKESENLIQAAILNNLSSDTLSFAANDHIIWGTHEKLGYLFIDSFNDYTEENKHPEALALLHSTMKQVIADFESTDGVIIDLRFNGGGYTYLAKALAEYFIASPQTGYIKSTRYGNQFTPEQFVTLTPAAHNYGKPVVVLISNTTASAAELATLMLSTSEKVTLIGEATQGMLSGSLIKSLPNGFIFGLSNMKQLSNQRVLYEQTGIPPMIQTSFFNLQERVSGTDKGFDAAVEWLLSQG
ncbi:S41 family peptidase [Pseudoalteromonas sp. 68 DY56-GL68]|uniref:S41 family peptidase n=1 Tax=Pseudoalteromonas sp. 68 DY56-GL68 TaxID=2974919 RepID=UPI003529F9D6